jgi:hypothetical protein
MLNIRGFITGACVPSTAASPNKFHNKQRERPLAQARMQFCCSQRSQADLPSNLKCITFYLCLQHSLLYVSHTCVHKGDSCSWEAAARDVFLAAGRLMPGLAGGC